MSDDSNQHLHDFTARSVQAGMVWGLKDTEGWAVCPSIEFEETDVLPFFSSEELARRLCTEQWQHYQPVSLSLDEFLEDWLPGMHEDNAMVGIDWSDELDGEEVEPADLAASFKQHSA